MDGSTPKSSRSIMSAAADNPVLRQVETPEESNQPSTHLSAKSDFKKEDLSINPMRPMMRKTGTVEID
jgi:hypothetical protein